MTHRVDRIYQTYSDSKLVEFEEKVGTNCTNDSLFASIKAIVDELIAETAQYKTYYKAVSDGDMRQKSKREKYRKSSLHLCNSIATEVNKLAGGDLTVIEAAGFEGTTAKAKDRDMGETKLESVVYDPKTGYVKIICTKADKAADYLVDISSDNKVWEEGANSIPLTKFLIEWKRGKGDFFIRLCPRDRKGKRGTVSNSLPLTIY